MTSIFRNSKLFMFLAVVALVLAFKVDSYDCKKTFKGDGTFYDVSLGACGETNNNHQFVCALNHEQFDPSPGGNPNKNKNCGKKIKVKHGRKTITCTIVDRCDGCKFGDIDMSPRAFKKLASLKEGRIGIKWSFK